MSAAILKILHLIEFYSSGKLGRRAQYKVGPTTGKSNVETAIAFALLLSVMPRLSKSSGIREAAVAHRIAKSTVETNPSADDVTTSTYPDKSC
mmetsp:Transcript_8394/g.12630  ORF Transcript_8394/g.12630 Transcript_8394/m.12630 type:complete len:93 (-) Transcript_8394:726-1004(-)